MLTLEERFTFESKTNVNFWETKIQSNFLEILFPFQPKNVWHSSSMYMNMSDNCQTLIQFRTVLVTHHPLFPVKQALRHWFRQSKVCQTLPTKAAHFACHQLQQGLLLVGLLQVTGVETGQLAFWQVKVHRGLKSGPRNLPQGKFLKLLWQSWVFLSSRVIRRVRSWSRFSAIMTPEMRDWLNKQIEVMMRRNPNITLIEMKTWIRDDPTHNWDHVKKQCFNNYIKRSMEKFRELGSFKRRTNPGSGGHNGISLAKARKIKRLGMNKLHTGTRRIGMRVGADQRTVATYLRKSGAKRAYHRRKVQKMTQDHMDKRKR